VPPSKCDSVAIELEINEVNGAMMPAGSLAAARTANPCSSVRFRGGPPTKLNFSTKFNEKIL